MASQNNNTALVNGHSNNERASEGNKWVLNRRRSCHGPNPVTKFGPKARLLDDCSVRNGMSTTSTCDPSNMILGWKSYPKQVLVIRKPGDDDVNDCFKEMAHWLVKDMDLVLYVESSTLTDPKVMNDTRIESIKKDMCTWKEGEDMEKKIDFIICLGGDGTLLYAASLFQSNCPPVIAFHIGSLGFLACFTFPDYKQDLTLIMKGNGKLILRKRLDCLLTSTSKTEDHNKNKEKEKSYTVLNELLIDRGTASYLSNIDVYCNDRFITSVQGDGLIISTPTGSTAYAAAAGGSMVHPSVPGILLTPVCPHSLSFRPVIVPAGVELKIALSHDSRSEAFASFDGRNRQELRRGDCIRVTTSVFPVPCLTKDDQINDWFNSLGRCLHWNERRKQKAIQY